MIGVILIAAGYGSLRVTATGNPVSKVLEHVRGIPMFLHPLVAAKDAGIDEAIIVANPLFVDAMRDEVQSAINAGLIPRSPEFVVQPDRYGSGHALQCAIPVARSRGMSRGLVCYGDMPLWSTGTMRALINASDETEVVTMVSAQRGASVPALDRYGRVMRNGNGAIKRVVEVDHASPEELSESTVNPSLWLWCLDWLEKNIPHVEPVARPDGRCAETHMPPLIGIAHAQGARIVEVCLPSERIHEALGVNSPEELSHVRSLME